MLASGDPPSSMAQLMNISKEMTEKDSGSGSSSKERKDRDKSKNLEENRGKQK
jgi:hypothetical protein